MQTYGRVAPLKWILTQAKERIFFSNICSTNPISKENLWAAKQLKREKCVSNCHLLCNVRTHNAINELERHEIDAIWCVYDRKLEKILSPLKLIHPLKSKTNWIIVSCTFFFLLLFGDLEMKSDTLINFRNI